jgi:hypothetical protein
MRTPRISILHRFRNIRAAAEPARLLVNGAVLRMEQAERRVTVTVVDREVVAIEV